MISGGLKIDGIPPERTFVVTVLLGRELVTDEHTVSRHKAVTQKEIHFFSDLPDILQ